MELIKFICPLLSKKQCQTISMTAPIQATLDTSDKNDLQLFCGMKIKFREDFDGWYTDLTHRQLSSAQKPCLKELCLLDKNDSEMRWAKPFSIKKVMV